MAAKVKISQDLTDSSDDEDSSVEVKEEPVSAEESNDEDDLSSIDDVEVKEEVNGDRREITGMAAVMSKILRKALPKDQPVIMSKALTERQLDSRKRKHLNEKQDGDLVVVKSENDVEVKKETIEATTEEKRIKKKKLNKTAAALKLKKEKERLCHAAPDPLDKSKELSLVKIATRGVVQLFNAVKDQQRKIKKKVGEAGTSIRKVDKAIGKFTSGDFLDTLKSQKVTTVSAVSEVDNKDIKQEVKEEPGWDVLKDDFMLGSQSMKDWDQQISNDDNENEEDSGD